VEPDAGRICRIAVTATRLPDGVLTPAISAPPAAAHDVAPVEGGVEPTPVSGGDPIPGGRRPAKAEVMAATAPAATRTPSAAPAPAALLASRIGGVLRSVPLACSVVAAVLAAGAVSGTLFSLAANNSPLVQQLSYGLPALRADRPLSFLGGALLVPQPALYPVMALLLGCAVGFLERRAGAMRAALVLIVTHLAGAFGAAGFLAAAGTLDWPWAQALAGQIDTGMSAGAVGVLAAGTALISPVWRARVRWVVGGYLALMLLRSGLLWDLEHAIGFVTGLAAGPLLRGRGAAAAPAADRPASERSGTRIDRLSAAPRLARIRGAVALLVLLVPVSTLVLALYPGYGGVFGPGMPSASSIPVVQHPLATGLIQLAIAAVIAKALRRGLPGAWWAGVVFAAVPLGRGIAVPELTGRLGDILAWAGVLTVLVVYRRCWPRRLPAVVLRRHLPRLVLATAAFAGIWWVVLTVAGPQLGVHSHGRGREILARATFGDGIAHADGRWVHFAMALSGWVWAGALVMLLLPMVHSHYEDHRRTTAAAQDRLETLLRTHGGGSLGWQRTWPGFAGWTTRAGDVAISYRIVSGVAIVLGDPVGPVDRWPAAVAEFRRFCLHAGWTACWYAVTPAFARHCGEGWNLTQIGEDAVLELAGLEFRGRSWQDVRTARNHASRDGIRMQPVDMATVGPELRAQIAEVSRGWTAAKPLPEMGFTLGTVEHARDPQMRAHIAVDADGVVHGVTTWMPVHADGEIVGWTLDVMRRRIGGFRPVIEFLIAESALAFKAEGFRTLSLSVAPLARCTTSGHAGPLDAVLEKVSRVLEPAYGFRSLLDFKRKFHPAFTPVFLGYADEVELSEISVAISRAYLPHLTPRQACRVVRTLWLARRGHGERRTRSDLALAG
jgi:lysylphosphatidylglycerol synthetase-like protein (DUF2156 family)